MEIIDSHAHISLNAEPSTLADGELLCALLDTVGRINIVNIVLEKPENLQRNGISLLLKLRYPGRIYSFGGIVMAPGRGDAGEYARQVGELMDAGFDGVKLFGKPSVRKSRPYPFDDPVYDGLYAELSRRGAPVNFHIGDPPEFWDRGNIPAWAWEKGWYYGAGDYPSMEELLEEIVRVLARFPGLKLLVPHMMFLSQDLARLGALLERFPNLLTDITPGRELYFQLSRDPGARAFFLRYRRRILFGTDNAARVSRTECLTECRENVAAIRRFLETGEEFSAWGGTLRGLALPEEVLQDLYGGNFIRWVGRSPKVPDGVRAKEYCCAALRRAERAGCSLAQRELAGVIAQMIPDGGGRGCPPSL